jgi:polyisoprenoid-binding protein YceI
VKLLLAALLLPVVAFAADTFELDPTHTYPSFAVSHMGLSIMQGRFNETHGSFVLDRKGDTSSVKVTVKTASLDSGMDARDQRLLAANFLDVEQFPEMSYESTAVSFTGEKTAKVEGKLTLHGVTRPLTLNVTSIKCAVHALKKVWSCGFEADGALKRSDYGIKTYLPDVGDEVQLRIEAEGQRIDRAPGPRR